jgi:hypothetical protein
MGSRPWILYWIVGTEDRVVGFAAAKPLIAVHGGESTEDGLHVGKWQRLDSFQIRAMRDKVGDCSAVSRYRETLPRFDAPHDGSVVVAKLALSYHLSHAATVALLACLRYKSATPLLSRTEQRKAIDPW